MDSNPELKPFSKAELKRLERMAGAANNAVANYNEFVGFLREQHEAEDVKLWDFNDRGFVRRSEPPQGDSSGIEAE